MNTISLKGVSGRGLLENIISAFAYIKQEYETLDAADDSPVEIEPAVCYT